MIFKRRKSNSKMSKNILNKCYGCQKIEIDGEWYERESFSGYDELVMSSEINEMACPECAEGYKEMYKKLRQDYQLLRN
jgi:hypothetical protein